MKTDMIFVLRTRWIQVTLLASLFFRLIFHFVYLPDKPSEFGPDEGTYGLLAGYVENGLPVDEFLGFGAGLYNSSRSFIIPSSALIRLGFTELDAVRAVASLYGILSSILIVLCLVAILRTISPEVQPRDYGLVVVLPVLLFTFLPSNFLWSTLGLRESTSQFWLISAFYFLLKLYFSRSMVLFAYLCLASLSLTFAFAARKETALVFAFSAFISGLYVAIRKRNATLVAAVALGVLGGQMFITTPQVKVTETYYLIPVNEFQSKSPTSKQSVESKSPTPKTKAPTGICKSEDLKVTVQSQEYSCIKVIENKKVVENPIRSITNQVAVVQNFERARNIRSIDAQSALPKSDCKNYESAIQTTIMCSIKELPYRLSSFLVRPFPFIDSGSTTFNLAGIENILWLLLFLFVLYLFISTRVTNVEKFVISSLAFYLMSFSVLASLYQGNLGTAFRHKSSILWSLVIILATLLWQKRKVLNYESQSVVRKEQEDDDSNHTHT